MWATSIQLFAYIQGHFNKLLLNLLMQKQKKKKKKKLLSHTKRGFFFKKKWSSRAVSGIFWRMVFACWLWAFLKHLMLFDSNIMAGLKLAAY